MSRIIQIRDIFSVYPLCQPSLRFRRIELQDGPNLTAEDLLRIPDEIIIAEMAFAPLLQLLLLMPVDLHQHRKEPSPVRAADQLPVEKLAPVLILDPLRWLFCSDLRKFLQLLRGHERAKLRHSKLIMGRDHIPGPSLPKGLQHQISNRLTIDLAVRMLHNTAGTVCPVDQDLSDMIHVLTLPYRLWGYHITSDEIFHVVILQEFSTVFFGADPYFLLV